MKDYALRLVVMTALVAWLAACGPAAGPQAEEAQLEAASETPLAGAALASSAAAQTPAAAQTSAPARTSAAAPTPAVDIVGLRLGMTPDEALAALEAFDPEMSLTLVESFFQYNDGVSHFKSDSFMGEIKGTRQGSPFGDDFILHFTPPPNGGLLWLVDRRENIRSNQPSIAQYGEALRQKYGEPTVASAEGLLLAWEFPAGAPTCLRETPTSPLLYYRPRRTNDMLYRLQYLQHRGRAPADLSTCAPQLNFELGTTNGQVVQSFNAILIDVASFFAANEAANAFVETLEAEARRKREGQGQAPRL